MPQAIDITKSKPWFNNLRERAKELLKSKDMPVQDNEAAINTIGNETVDQR